MYEIRIVKEKFSFDLDYKIETELQFLALDTAMKQGLNEFKLSEWFRFLDSLSINVFYFLYLCEHCSRIHMIVACSDSEHDEGIYKCESWLQACAVAEKLTSTPTLN